MNGKMIAPLQKFPCIHTLTPWQRHLQSHSSLVNILALQHCFSNTLEWLFLPQITRLQVVACLAALWVLMHLQKDCAVRHLNNLIGLVSSPFHNVSREEEQRI